MSVLGGGERWGVRVGVGKDKEKAKYLDTRILMTEDDDKIK